MGTAPQMAAVPAPSTVSGSELFATATNVGAATVVTLQLSNEGFAKVALARVKAKHTAGTAANFTLRIFSKSGVTTAGDISQEYAGASTAVATLFDPSEPQSAPVPMVTDANGRLYLMFTPDAGADNTFQYMLRFHVHR
jgi:hypothetical protein